MEKGKRISTIILLSGIALIYIVLYNILLPKSGMVSEFYKQDEKTVDVLFLGSSNSYANINPAILYEKAGITSYMFCGSGQPIWNSYYYLQEAYKTQAPQVVVLDVLSMGSYPDGYEALSSVAGNTLNLHYSNIMFENIGASVPAENKQDLILGLPVFHNRWTEIINNGIESLNTDMANGAMQKGFHPVFFQSAQNKTKYYDGVIKPSDKNVDYLNRILELTKQKGSKLLLIKTPYAVDGYFDGIFNWVEEYAQTTGIEYINFNRISDQILFDYETDMADVCHLNNLGVDKVTRYLADILSTKYGVYNRKNDIKYHTWSEYYDLWEQTKFMAPCGYQGDEIHSENLEYYALSEKHSLLQKKIILEQNCYYKVTFESSGEGVDTNWLLIDIFGENYDKADQKRLMNLRDKDPFVIIKTDSDLPEDTWIRILGNFDEHSFSDIHVFSWAID